VAAETARYMEYQGQGWLNPNSNQAYRVQRSSSAAYPVCRVCDMEVDPATAATSVYRERTYYFCTPAHKAMFDKKPEQFLDSSAA
jgi:YHS domain-containing protein